MIDDAEELDDKEELLAAEYPEGRRHVAEAPPRREYARQALMAAAAGGGHHAARSQIAGVRQLDASERRFLQQGQGRPRGRR